MSTTFATPKTAARQWLLIDANNQVLGRLASRIALVLRGKHKPTFTPFLDAGDFVVVINAEKIALTGQKLNQKFVQRYSGYPGGLRATPVGKILAKHPERVLRKAVKGMMPHGPLGRQMLTKLKIYPGTEHPHQAQQPRAVTLTA